MDKITDIGELDKPITDYVSGLEKSDDLSEDDMPEGTVITVPYYTDLNVLVTLK